MRLIDADALIGKMKDCGFSTAQELMANAFCFAALKSETLAPTVGGWISVKERLPEKSGTYLCYQADAAYFMRINTYRWSEAKENWMGCQIGSVITRITHWMPLPEPPEEEDENGDKADPV